MNVAASAANLHPWPVLDPEEDVIRAFVQYHIHLSRAHAEPLSEIHIIVVAGLSTSYLSGFLTSPKMLFLAVSFSYKPSLAIHCVQWSATTNFSILFIGSPETVFATSKILTNLNPASKEMISDSVELCETEVCFLHIELIGTNV